MKSRINLAIEKPELVFATGNAHKFVEAQKIAERYGIDLRVETLEIDEIQSSDPAGKFADDPRGINGNSIEKVVILADGETIAEKYDTGGVANNSVVLQVWEEFFQWYCKGDL